MDEEVTNCFVLCGSVAATVVGCWLVEPRALQNGCFLGWLVQGDGDEMRVETRWDIEDIFVSFVFVFFHNVCSVLPFSLDDAFHKLRLIIGTNRS
jgi:hypothetical protein